MIPLKVDVKVEVGAQTVPGLIVGLRQGTIGIVDPLACSNRG